MNKNRFSWPILGHQSIINFLQTSIINNKINHAYIFYGPEHLGKGLVANYFVNSIQCEEYNHENDAKIPCQKCNACRQIEKGMHPDIYKVKKEENKKNISIEQVRELQHKLSMRSFLTSYKIAIIDQAESISLEAANSLLKTIEEPTTKTIIILITNKLEALPTTILSRCQILKFNFINPDSIYNFLRQGGADKEIARNLSLLSQGKPGLAHILLKKKGVFEEYQNNVSYFFDLIKSNIINKLKIINELTKKKDNYQNSQESFISMIDIWISLLRDIFLIKNNNLKEVKHQFIKNKLINIAKKLNIFKIKKYIILLINIKKYLEFNINPKLLLEDYFLNIKII